MWLDLAQDPKQAPILRVLQDGLDDDDLALIVPRDYPNRVRKESGPDQQDEHTQLAGHFHASGKAGGDVNEKKRPLAQICDVSHKVPLIGGTPTSTTDAVAKLFDRAEILETPETAKVRATERALAHVAP